MDKLTSSWTINLLHSVYQFSCRLGKILKPLKKTTKLNKIQKQPNQEKHGCIHNQYARNGCTEYTEQERQLNDEIILDQEKHITIVDEAIKPPVNYAVTNTLVYSDQAQNLLKNTDGTAPTSWPTSTNLHLTQTQITQDRAQRTISFYGRTRIKTWCGLTQNTTNIRQGVLAQITKDNFFLWKDKDTNQVRVSTITNNKEITRSI